MTEGDWDLWGQGETEQRASSQNMWEPSTSLRVLASQSSAWTKPCPPTTAYPQTFIEPILIHVSIDVEVLSRRERQLSFRVLIGPIEGVVTVGRSILHVSSPGQGLPACGSSCQMAPWLMLVRSYTSCQTSSGSHQQVRGNSEGTGISLSLKTSRPVILFPCVSFTWTTHFQINELVRRK